MPAYHVSIQELTKVKVSKETEKKLAVLQNRLHKESIDATIRALVSSHRRELVEDVFDANKEKIPPSSEQYPVKILRDAYE